MKNTKQTLCSLQRVYTAAEFFRAEYHCSLSFVDQSCLERYSPRLAFRLSVFGNKKLQNCRRKSCVLSQHWVSTKLALPNSWTVRNHSESGGKWSKLMKHMQIIGTNSNALKWLENCESCSRFESSKFWNSKVSSKKVPNLADVVWKRVRVFLGFWSRNNYLRREKIFWLTF